MDKSFFTSENDFKQAFRAGLLTMLQQPDLGCFILVCANVYGDQQLHEAMLPEIEKRFQQLQVAVTSGAMQSGELTATDEDREIFLKLMEHGLAAIPLVQYRNVGDWRCQFNHLRTFRPTRMAAKKVSSLHQAFDPQGFNFNKPFLQKERLWEGDWQGARLSWYYNKFPFARYHGLLVPEREHQHPQYLTEAMHTLVWQVMQHCASHFHGLGIGFNSLGAFASVNHLHFQWFIEPGGLPVMSSHWQHNGGEVAYPLTCFRFNDSQEAWQQIHEWHEQSVAYNLLYAPGVVYAIARKMQSQVSHEPWTSGFSWIETVGEIVMQTSTAFDEITVDVIEREMAKLRL